MTTFNPAAPSLSPAPASSNGTGAAIAPCPECDAAVSFARRPLAGEVVRCTDCTAELEVTSTAPITLALAPQVEEDWGE